MVNQSIGQEGIGAAERIERLPMTWVQYRLVLIVALAWLLEAFDIGIIGVVLVPLSKIWNLSTSAKGLLAVASTVGIVVGVTLLGHLADRIGRKRMMIYGMIWYAVFTMLGAITNSWFTLAIIRFLAGLGMGCFFPLPYGYISELVPSHVRGALAGVMDSCLSLGYFIAPLLAMVIIPIGDTVGWRIMFSLGGLPILYSLLIKLYLSESPRWLEVKGKFKEAEEILSKIEKEVEERTGRPLSPVEKFSVVKVVKDKVPVAEIWGPQYLKRTIMSWIQFPTILFMFYAIMTYMPSVFAKQGFAYAATFGFSAIIMGASIPGKFFEAWAVERWGRKPVIVSFALIAAIGALMFGRVHTINQLLIYGIILSFFGIGVNPAQKIYTAEQYPTRIRATGVALTEGIGRLFGGVLAPYYMAFLLDKVGINGSFIFICAMATVGALTVAILGEETKGKTLEVISEVSNKALKG